jgi:DNA mismatch endonuclease (patch repair protein)
MHMGTRTKEQISNNMRRVRSKDSQIELLLRKELWRRGLRYRKNVSRIEGKPDIAFIGKKVAVFCDSEFWHGYNWEEKKDDFKSNRDFWIPKIERNMMRDVTVNAVLEYDGWTVLRFWGADIIKDAAGCADVVEAALRDAEARLPSRPSPPRAGDT